MTTRNAAALRLRADERSGAAMKRHMDAILTYCESVADLGKYGVTYEIPSAMTADVPAVMAELQRLGFKVSHGSDQRDPNSWLTISWSNA